MIFFFNDIKSTFINPALINKPFERKASFYLLYLFIGILFFIFFYIFLGLVVEIFGLEIPKPKNNNFSVINILLTAPIIEEFCFRANLKKNISNLFLFIIGLTYLSLNVFSLTDQFLVLSIFILIISNFYFYQNENENYSRKQILYLTYINSLFFGLGHIYNYSYSEKYYLFFTIYIVLKILAGFLLSMLRIKFGLIYSIIFHFIINFIGYLFLLHE